MLSGRLEMLYSRLFGLWAPLTGCFGASGPHAAVALSAVYTVYVKYRDGGRVIIEIHPNYSTIRCKRDPMKEGEEKEREGRKSAFFSLLHH